MIKTYSIPDYYYQYGTPYRTNYLDNDGSGLAYPIGGEELHERRAAFGPDDSGWTVISLTSPYIVGFDEIGKWDFQKSSVLTADIENRTVMLHLVEK